MPTLPDKVSEYVDKLVLQYRTIPKARATIAILGKQVMADDLATAVALAYAIDTAVGTQLDVIGKYVGVARNINTPLAQAYFGLWSYASSRSLALYKGTWDPSTNTPTLPAAGAGNTGWWYVASATASSTSPIAEDFIAGDVIFSNGSVWAKSTADNGNGFTDYSDPSINRAGQFYDYTFQNSLNTNLADGPYRQVIKLKIASNANDGTLSSIVEILNDLFPGLIYVTDSADMTLTYYVSFKISLPKTVLEQYLPKPMGVGITVIVEAGLGLLLTEDGDFLTTEAGDKLIIT